MTKVNYNIYELNASTLSGFKQLPDEDLNLLYSANVNSSFIPNKNIVEVTYFTLDDVAITTIENYNRYSILSGGGLNDQQGNTEISIDVLDDYKAYGYEGEEVKVVYNFLDYLYSDNNIKQDFYIESISADRTELRLVAVGLEGAAVADTTEELVEKLNTDTYQCDFNIYFGQNIFFPIVNLKTQEFRETNALIVKLSSPISPRVKLKTTLSLINRIADSVAYEVDFTVEEEKIAQPTLRGANFNINIEEQSTEPSGYYNYNELFSFPVNNSNRELNSLFNEKGAELGIQYDNFANFINFSSIEERIRNFRYKLDLLQTYQTSLDQFNSDSTLTAAYSGTGISGSSQYYTSLVNGVVNNFDHYERHLFYSSGSTSWPKSNSSKPFINQNSDTSEAIAWYNTEISTASNYDAQNPDILINTVPSYLREDSDNDPYLMFIHMIGQHFDNLWTYTDAVSKKYDADNRLNVGVSKDLVEELLKNFGVKLYTSNKSVEDLFRYFTVNSYEAGEEILSGNNPITSGEEPLSQNDYQKEIYKRIYHNLPLLMKSKGTERGLRALINCFGIPSDVLKIKIFGGQSAENLPFYGGEQAWTGSLDKVRTNNTGSIVPGDTLSFYTPITRLDDKYTQDLHRIEVGFSPSDNVNDYIVSQSAVLFPNEGFNIDQYIGDPRGYETNTYLDLYKYAEIILANVSAYDVKDFVRLIKFFDNVIFRMVRDFTPARAVTDAGIIIKPHLLERYKAESPVMTWTQPEYLGSIKTGFTSGSDGGIYRSNADNSYSTNITYTPQIPNNGIYDREATTRYQLKIANPFTGSLGVHDEADPFRLHKPYVYLNNFHYYYPDIPPQIKKTFDEAKYDGELAGSLLGITNGELNSSNPFKNIEYPVIKYDTQFWSDIPNNVCILNSPTTPYVTGSGISIYIPASSIFSGHTSYYDFSTDDEDLLSNDTLIIPSTLDQYEEFEVTATHPNNPLPNSITGESNCERTRTVKIVNCGFEGVFGAPPPYIQENHPYNLLGWFFPSVDILADLINTNLEFYVNDTSIGFVDTTEISSNFGVDSSVLAPSGESGTPTNYEFTNIGNAEELVVTVADEFDPSNCNLWISAGTTLCALQDMYFQEPAGNTDLNITVGGSGNLFYAYPFMFNGATQSTQFSFRVFIRQTNTNKNWGPTQWFDIGISDINNPTPFWNAGDGSVVPNAWTAPAPAVSITGDYQNDFEGAVFPEVLQDPAFQNTNNTPNPFLDNGLPLPSPDIDDVNFNGNFLRFIQFRAVQDDNCDAEGHYFLIKRGIPVRTGITFVYKQETAVDVTTASQACSVLRVNQDNFRTVYVEHSQDSTPPTAHQVIMQMYRIYATDDVDDPTPAATGYYMYDVDPDDVFQSWYLGRRGRVWKINEASQTQSRHWDSLTDYDAEAAFSAGAVWFNTGRLICESVDGDGTTDDPIDFEDAGGSENGIDWGNGTGDGSDNPFFGPK